MKYDLTWGSSVAVRKALLDTLEHSNITFDKAKLLDFGYPTHEGDERLVARTKDVIYRQTGQVYKHVFLANGATGGVVTALRAYFQHSYKYCLTLAPPYFSMYPQMIENSGLIHMDRISSEIGDGSSSVMLLDSPSNPTGRPFSVDRSPNCKVQLVWDAVYHNNVYFSEYPKMVPSHDVMVGSYSKLLGLNGIRVGWVATNDDTLAKTIGQVITGEYIGLSRADTEILLHILDNLDWNEFESTARAALKANRDEWSKIEHLVGSAPKVGMFAYSLLTSRAKAILARAGVEYMPGSKCHDSDEFGRFNLGQDTEVIKAAVKAILKEAGQYKRPK